MNWFDHNSHFVIRCGTCQKNYIYLLFWFLITNILGQILQKFVRGQDNRCFVKVNCLEIYLIWKNRKSLTPPCFIQDIGLLNLVTMTLEMYTPPPPQDTLQSWPSHWISWPHVRQNCPLVSSPTLLLLTDEMIVKAREFFSSDLDTTRPLAVSASNYNKLVQEHFKPESSGVLLSSPESSWILLSPPESSWVLLSPPESS